MEKQKENLFNSLGFFKFSVINRHLYHCFIKKPCSSVLGSEWPEMGPK